MANFATHVSTAAIISTMTATAYLATGRIDSYEALVLSFVGTLGGILPDIDAGHARPLRVIFIGFYALIALSLVQNQSQDLSIIEIWLLLAVLYISLKYILLDIFKRSTSHRGIYHSLLMAVFMGLLLTKLSATWFQFPPYFAWLSGLFLGFGFVIHLLLDEFYSVDFNNRRLKKSFGSAFKLLNHKQWGHSLILLALTLMLLQQSPPTRHFKQIVFSSKTYIQMAQQFFPKKWWWQKL